MAREMTEDDVRAAAGLAYEFYQSLHAERKPLPKSRHEFVRQVKPRLVEIDEAFHNATQVMRAVSCMENDYHTELSHAGYQFLSR